MRQIARAKTAIENDVTIQVHRVRVKKVVGNNSEMSERWLLLCVHKITRKKRYRVTVNKDFWHSWGDLAMVFIAESPDPWHKVVIHGNPILFV